MRLNCRFTIPKHGSSGRSKKSGSSEDAEPLRRGNAELRFILVVSIYGKPWMPWRCFGSRVVVRSSELHEAIVDLEMLSHDLGSHVAWVHRLRCVGSSLPLSVHNFLTISFLYLSTLAIQMQVIIVFVYSGWQASSGGLTDIFCNPGLLRLSAKRPIAQIPAKNSLSSD